MLEIVSAEAETSLRRHYPASAVLRTSPSPHPVRPIPRGLPVGRSSRPRNRASRVASTFLLPTCHRPYPGGVNGCASLASPSMTTFPEFAVGSVSTSLFSRLAQRSLIVMACQLAKSPMATLYTEGFSRFVTSTTAPIASGRSDRGRAGLAPAGRPCLCTAHAKQTLRHLSDF